MHFPKNGKLKFTRPSYINMVAGFRVQLVPMCIKNVLVVFLRYTNYLVLCCMGFYFYCNPNFNNFSTNVTVKRKFCCIFRSCRGIRRIPFHIHNTLRYKNSKMFCFIIVFLPLIYIILILNLIFSILEYLSLNVGR